MLQKSRKKMKKWIYNQVISKKLGKCPNKCPNNVLKDVLKRCPKKRDNIKVADLIMLGGSFDYVIPVLTDKLLRND
jgi:hypothetical protein